MSTLLPRAEPRLTLHDYTEMLTEYFAGLETILVEVDFDLIVQPVEVTFHVV